MNRYYLNEGFKLSEYGLKLEEKFRLVEDDERKLDKAINKVSPKLADYSIKLTNVKELLKKYSELYQPLINIQNEYTDDKLDAQRTNIGNDDNAFRAQVSTPFIDSLKAIINKASNTDETVKNELQNKINTAEKTLNTVGAAKAISTIKSLKNELLNSLKAAVNQNYPPIEDIAELTNKIIDAVLANIKIYNKLTADQKALIQTKAEVEAIENLANAIHTEALESDKPQFKNLKKKLESLNATLVSAIKAIEAVEGNKNAADINAAEKATTNNNKIDWKARLDEAIKHGAETYSRARKEFYAQFWGGNIDAKFAQQIEYFGEAIMVELNTFGSNPQYNPMFKYIDVLCSITRDEQDNIKTIGEPKKIINMSASIYAAIHNSFARDKIKKDWLTGKNKANILWASGLIKLSGADVNDMLEIQYGILTKKGNYADDKISTDLKAKYATSGGRELLNYNIFVKGNLGATDEPATDYALANIDTLTTLTTVKQLITDCFGEDVETKANMTQTDIDEFIKKDIFKDIKNVYSVMNFIGITTDNMALINKYSALKSAPELGSVKFIAQINDLLKDFELTKATGASIIEALAKEYKVQ